MSKYIHATIEADLGDHLLVRVKWKADIDNSSATHQERIERERAGMQESGDYRDFQDVRPMMGDGSFPFYEFNLSSSPTLKNVFGEKMDRLKRWHARRIILDLQLPQPVFVGTPIIGYPTWCLAKQGPCVWCENEDGNGGLWLLTKM